MPTFKGQAVDSVVILTGAGVSAESGIATFRDADGLWENHDPRDVATPEAFARDPAMVHRFYNARRAQLGQVQPNAAHRAIAQLQKQFDGDVFLVTQNVDDLHERGGSEQVCHMHGELGAMYCRLCRHSMPAATTFDQHCRCPSCSETGGLRPDIVWFGEMPYHMDDIEARLAACDLFVALGTSGAVYPAAGFVQRAIHHGATAVELNLERSDVSGYFHHRYIGPATEQTPALVDDLLA